MPLRGDQRALLQLLCERGQSYDDISGLLGASSDEIRAQARAALEELGGADPDAEVGLTDYLMGQADPIGRADAVRYLQTDPEALELARRIEQELRAIAPDATLPTLPEPRGKRSRAAMPAPGEDPSPLEGGEDGVAIGSTASRRTIDPRQSRVIAALAAVGVILIFAVLAIAGVFSGGGETSSASSSSTDATTTADANRMITTVKLAPVGGSGVGGTARFGLANASQLYVDLNVQGLTAQPRSRTTLAWLMVGDSGGYPINNPAQSPITPDESGNYQGRIAVPGPVAATIGSNATSVKISSSPIAKVSQAAKAAAKQQAPILPFIGTELASGDIPLAEDAAGAAQQAPGTAGGATPAPGGGASGGVQAPSGGGPAPSGGG